MRKIKKIVILVEVNKMNNSDLSKEAIETRRKYYRKYYNENKEKQKLNDKKYWENKALKENKLINAKKEL